MIARNEGNESVWAKLAAPLPPDEIQWRQDGRPVARDGKHVARFVAFIDAQFVRQRFDAVVPGEWDLTLEPLPNRVTFNGEEEAEPYAFKARIQVLGVSRESVGQGKDYKTAETDAFKRAAVRFGIAAELYAFGQNWVAVDGDGKYAKPVEDPANAYARRYGRPNLATGGEGAARPTTNGTAAPSSTTGSPAPSSAPAAEGDVIHDGTGDPRTVGEPSCPKCQGRVWDNRLTKRNPRAPDFKCRDKACDGVIWPPKGEKNDKPAADEPEEIPF